MIDYIGGTFRKRGGFIVYNYDNPTAIVEIDLLKLVKQSIWLTIGSLIALFGIHFIVNAPFHFAFSFRSILKTTTLFSIGYVALIVLHEFFHLLGFRLFAQAPWHSMKVGVDLKQGIAYATTDRFMTNAAVRKALLLPFWLTGIVPAILAILINSTTLLVLAAFLIGGAAGDFAMYRQLKRFPNHWLIKDDPKMPKLYVYKTK